MMGSGPVDGDGNEGNGNDNSVSEGGDPVFGNFFDAGILKNLNRKKLRR